MRKSYRTGNIWAIRDLGSTNGTQVNGKPVRESFLSDGDILAIAETEGHVCRLVGHPVPADGDAADSTAGAAQTAGALPPEIARHARLTEATLWQAIPLQLDEVVGLDSGESEACFAHLAKTTILTESEFTRFARRGPALSKLFSAPRDRDGSSSMHGESHFSCRRASAEFESPRPLVGRHRALARPAPAAIANWELPFRCRRFSTPRRSIDIARELRKAELLLAVVGFQGSSSQVLELASQRADYLVLSDTMLKGLTAGASHCAVWSWCWPPARQLGIKAVLPPCACRDNDCSMPTARLPVWHANDDRRTKQADRGKRRALAS